MSQDLFCSVVSITYSLNFINKLCIDHVHVVKGNQCVMYLLLLCYVHFIGEVNELYIL